MKNIVFFICLVLAFAAYGQQQKPFNDIKALKVGDRVPEILFSKIVNGKFSSARLSDFRGKLVILDFWSAYCADCIEAFPKMASIQQKFEDEIVILPVGFNLRKDNEITDLLARKKGTFYELSLPSVVEDFNKSALSKLFPIPGFPLEIWIDGNGVLRGITRADAVTENNINLLLNDNSAQLGTIKLAKMFKGGYLLLEPSSIKTAGTPKSKFSAYIDSIRYEGEPFIDSIDKSVWRVTNINAPIPGSYFYMYSHLYKDFSLIANKLGEAYYKFMFLDFPKGDSRSIGYREARNYDNWERDRFNKNSLFCYEAILPIEMSKEDVCKFVLDDFDRYFQISSFIQKRKARCLALISTKKFMPFKSTPASLPRVSRGEVNLKDLDFKAQPIDFLLSELNSSIDTIVILNETGYSGNIDIKLVDVKQNDLKSYRRALNKNGLDLIEVEREIPMLVLKDSKK